MCAGEEKVQESRRLPTSMSTRLLRERSVAIRGREGPAILVGAPGAILAHSPTRLAGERRGATRGGDRGMNAATRDGASPLPASPPALLRLARLFLPLFAALLPSLRAERRLLEPIASHRALAGATGSRHTRVQRIALRSAVKARTTGESAVRLHPRIREKETSPFPMPFPPPSLLRLLPSSQIGPPSDGNPCLEVQGR